MISNELAAVLANSALFFVTWIFLIGLKSRIDGLEFRSNENCGGRSNSSSKALVVLQEEGYYSIISVEIDHPGLLSERKQVINLALLQLIELGKRDERCLLGHFNLVSFTRFEANSKFVRY